MAYFIYDKELNRSFAFQYEPSMKTRYTTKGNEFHRYEDRFGNMGVSFTKDFLIFLIDTCQVNQVGDNLFKTIEE